MKVKQIDISEIDNLDIYKIVKNLTYDEKEDIYVTDVVYHLINILCYKHGLTGYIMLTDTDINISKYTFEEMTHKSVAQTDMIMKNELYPSKSGFFENFYPVKLHSKRYYLYLFEDVSKGLKKGMKELYLAQMITLNDKLKEDTEYKIKFSGQDRLIEFKNKTKLQNIAHLFFIKVEKVTVENFVSDDKHMKHLFKMLNSYQKIKKNEKEHETHQENLLDAIEDYHKDSQLKPIDMKEMINLVKSKKNQTNVIEREAVSEMEAEIKANEAENEVEIKKEKIDLSKLDLELDLTRENNAIYLEHIKNLILDNFEVDENYKSELKMKFKTIKSQKKLQDIKILLEEVWNNTSNLTPSENVTVGTVKDEYIHYVDYYIQLKNHEEKWNKENTKKIQDIITELSKMGKDVKETSPSYIRGEYKNTEDREQRKLLSELYARSVLQEDIVSDKKKDISYSIKKYSQKISHDENILAKKIKKILSQQDQKLNSLIKNLGKNPTEDKIEEIKNYLKESKNVLPTQTEEDKKIFFREYDVIATNLLKNSNKYEKLKNYVMDAYDSHVSYFEEIAENFKDMDNAKAEIKILKSKNVTLVESIKELAAVLPFQQAKKFIKRFLRFQYIYSIAIENGFIRNLGFIYDPTDESITSPLNSNSKMDIDKYKIHLFKKKKYYERGNTDPYVYTRNKFTCGKTDQDDELNDVDFQDAESIIKKYNNISIIPLISDEKMWTTRNFKYKIDPAKRKFIEDNGGVSSIEDDIIKMISFGILLDSFPDNEILQDYIKQSLRDKFKIDQIKKINIKEGLKKSFESASSIYGFNYPFNESAFLKKINKHKDETNNNKTNNNKTNNNKNNNKNNEENNKKRKLDEDTTTTKPVKKKKEEEEEIVTQMRNAGYFVKWNKYAQQKKEKNQDKDKEKEKEEKEDEEKKIKSKKKRYKIESVIELVRSTEKYKNYVKDDKFDNLAKKFESFFKKDKHINYVSCELNNKDQEITYKPEDLTICCDVKDKIPDQKFFIESCKAFFGNENDKIKEIDELISSNSKAVDIETTDKNNVFFSTLYSNGKFVDEKKYMIFLEILYRRVINTKVNSVTETGISEAANPKNSQAYAFVNFRLNLKFGNNQEESKTTNMKIFIDVDESNEPKGFMNLKKTGYYKYSPFLRTQGMSLEEMSSAISLYHKNRYMMMDRHPIIRTTEGLVIHKKLCGMSYNTKTKKVWNGKTFRKMFYKNNILMHFVKNTFKNKYDMLNVIKAFLAIMMIDDEEILIRNLAMHKLSTENEEELIKDIVKYKRKYLSSYKIEKNRKVAVEVANKVPYFEKDFEDLVKIYQSIPELKEKFGRISQYKKGTPFEETESNVLFVVMLAYLRNSDWKKIFMMNNWEYVMLEDFRKKIMKMDGNFIPSYETLSLLSVIH